MTSRTAQCFCGQLRIEVNGEPVVGLRHCLACGGPSFEAQRVSVYDVWRHPWIVLHAGSTVYEKGPVRGLSGDA